PGNLLVREIENQLAGTGNIRGFAPSCLRDREARRTKVEQRLDLGAPCIEDRIVQIDTDRSADPVGEKVEGEPAPLRVVEAQGDAVSAARPVLGLEDHAAIDVYRNAVEACAALEVDARSADVDSKIAVA